MVHSSLGLGKNQLELFASLPQILNGCLVRSFIPFKFNKDLIPILVLLTHMRIR